MLNIINRFIKGKPFDVYFLIFSFGYLMTQIVLVAVKIHFIDYLNETTVKLFIAYLLLNLLFYPFVRYDWEPLKFETRAFSFRYIFKLFQVAVQAFIIWLFTPLIFLIRISIMYRTISR